ncbi:cysteine desulfurase family protein [Microbacterium sediminicola]|uniref:Cysteine desulfurase family protein n=1 Tax=Microbacterium sediminicola TaxID=415210 RepID=A0ABP4TQY6_9MICO
MTIYLDHAASAPLRPEAAAAWLEASREVGNASSIHGSGQVARRSLEEARERLASLVEADPAEIVFTSGGTESINLALKGMWTSRLPGTTGIVLPDGEHHATLDSVEWLAASQGAQILPVPLDVDGRIGHEGFCDALSGAALATALVANNEVGTLNDAAGLARAASDAGVPLHLDAVAAFGHVPVSFRQWRADAAPGAGLVALSVAGHKIGAPVGVGALAVARSARIAPLLHGGRQQRGLRAGTQDVAGAVAFAAAAEIALAERETEARRLAALRDGLVSAVTTTIPDARLLGDPTRRIPGNAHLHFPGALGETLLFLLDQAGISVSTGSACQAGVAEPSHVVLAMGHDATAAREVLRITLGHTTTPADVAALAAALPEAVARARGAGSGRRS